MTRWELLTDDGARLIWDEGLAQFDDCSPFQSYAWGEYRRGLGWLPYRWAAFDEHNEIQAMMQGYVRRHPFGVGLLWSEGGPVGDLSICDEGLQTVIRETVGLKRLYCRFRCDRSRNVEDVLRLNAQGWNLPWAPMNSNFSMILDLAQDESALVAKCSRSWRGNLRAAGKKNLPVRPWLDPNIDEIMSVFGSMQRAKGLDEQHSREEITELLEKVGAQLVIYRCDDSEGRVISLSGAIVAGRAANLWLMATTEEGRKVKAAFGTFWAVIQHCRKLGVHSLDMGGIDPVRNPGVYRFKKDTGAVPIELLGEWDWASRPWLRWLGNLAIAQRSRLRRSEGQSNNSASARPQTRVTTLAPAMPAGKGPITARAN